MPVIPAVWEADARNHLNQEVEVAVSRDHITALLPGQQSETVSEEEEGEGEGEEEEEEEEGGGGGGGEEEEEEEAEIKQSETISIE